MGSPHGQGFGEPIGGLNEKIVDKTPTRGLRADATAPEAGKTTWIDKIITDPVDGGFTLNVLAGILVHVLIFIATILGTCIFYGRARKRERIARYLENQRQLGQTLALSRFLESNSKLFGSQGSSSTGSPGTPPVLQADNSTTHSPPTPPPPVPEDHVRTAGSTPAGSVRGSPTSSTNAAPTEPKEAGPTSKRLPDHLRRRKLNGIIKSRSMGHFNSTFSESPLVATPYTEHHVIDIPPFPCSCYFPTLTEKTKEEDKFKEKADKLGVDFKQVCSSRLMQASVPATEENLSVLREVAIEGMKLDKGFTLQIGASFLYCCSDDSEEPDLLSLRDVEVPTILQAEYSAGMLTVRGRYLEGAEIRAATAEGYMIFASVKQDPIDNEVLPEERIGTWRCTDLLPPVNLDQIQIFASKTVQIEEQSVTVRSEFCSIENTTLRTVIYRLVPTIIIMNILGSQLWSIWMLFTKLVTNPLQPWLSYPTLALTIYTIQLLSPRYYIL